jgi:tetratricopeptide (TPR) repeat protein
MPAENEIQQLCNTMTQSADSLISRADLLYAKGRCDEAVQLLTDSLARSPSQADIVTRLAEFLIDSGWHARALEFLKNTNAAANNARALLLRGLCHEALGNFSDIAAHLLAQVRHCANALALKARIAAGANATDTSERLFHEAVTCDPDCGMAWHGLACLRRQQGDPQAYHASVRKAFLVLPESREIAIAFHDSGLSSGSLEDTEAAFREVLARRPMDRRLRFFLIDILLRRSKFAEAMAEIESVLVDFGVDEGILAAALNLRARFGPLSISANPKPGGSVSLCMIVKNEEKHLARCLHSVKPIVDEIVMVDTGSTDCTKEIGVAFGAHVVDFPWVDDFSKARNFALSQASGDWILVLDADEILSARDHENFRKLINSVQTGPAAFCIRTRNYTRHVNAVGWQPNTGEYPEEEGPGWIPSDKVRLFTNDARIRFSHAVHELVEPALRNLNIAVSTCDIPVHHYGKLQEGKTHEKTRAYSNLSRKKLKKTNRDSVAVRELAIQSSQLGRHEELQPQSAEAHLNIGTAYWNLARYAEAADFADKAVRLDPTLKEARFNRAIALLLAGRAEETKSILQEVVAQHPEYPAAQFLLCVAHACLEEQSQIGNALNTLIPLAMGEYIGESFLDIARRFLSASRADYARLTLEAALRLGYVNSETVSLLESCRSAAA